MKDKLARLQDQIEDDRRLIEVEREKVVSVKSQKDAVDKHVAECHRLLDRANKINTAGAQEADVRRVAQDAPRGVEGAQGEAGEGEGRRRLNYVACK